MEQIIALARTERTEYVQGFHDQNVKQVKLSTLRTDFEKERTRTAIQRLRSRHTVSVDEELLHKKNDGGLAWSAREHFLDYYLLIPARRGLDVLLPMSQGDPSYVFKLDLHKRHKQWQARYGDLEFDPTGRMLYIGTYGQEEVWLAMVPRMFLDEEMIEEEGELAGARRVIERLEGSTTSMSEGNYSLMVMYLAYQLKRQGYRDIYPREDYSENLSVARVRQVTNLL